MIRIKSVTQPVVWQIDNKYLLPAQSGQVRWNGNNKEFEVCDNSGIWYRINPEIELRNDEHISEVIEWAKKRMELERKIEKLASQYPAVKDAKEKLDIIMKLVQDERTS
ncbi:MAG: hypothetical protein EB127_05795 [Alphaproteobacteria bacterium]|nr:hypothetical protein [Alphaproteobacteria bacterium]